MGEATFTILGCGNSTGVPAIGNYWGQCDPNEPKNARTRCSALLQTDKANILIDTGPDFRAQLNRENISQIDAVLYTHQHSDHVNGMDDLRVIRFRNQKLVPVYANEETLEDLGRRFEYIFHGGKIDLYPPIIEQNAIADSQFGKVIDVQGVSVVPFKQDHGTCDSVGYRFGDLAYSVDLLTLDDSAIDTLKGVKTWVVDCAAHNNNDNKVHASIDNVYALNKQIGAEKVILTSLSLSMDYNALKDELKSGYKPAYDGMRLKLGL